MGQGDVETRGSPVHPNAFQLAGPWHINHLRCLKDHPEKPVFLWLIVVNSG